MCYFVFLLCSVFFWVSGLGKYDFFVEPKDHELSKMTIFL